MGFLADENFPLDAVEALRQSGHDVAWIRSGFQLERVLILEDRQSLENQKIGRASCRERVLMPV